MVKELTIKAGKMTLEQLRMVVAAPVHLMLDSNCYPDIVRSHEAVAKVITDGRTVYGVNTGFGLLANTKIAPDDLELLQRSIVVSHAAGVGNLMSEATVRLMMVLKINSLARGFSGVRLCVLEYLIQLVNSQVYPCIPEKGSVGASGDLAPLAHMSAVLIGEGEALYQGEIISANQAFDRAGLSPLILAPKEGLALLNGTQASTALALEGLFMIEDLYASSPVAGSMSVDAALGSRYPFDARLHEVRGQKGQMARASNKFATHQRFWRSKPMGYLIIH